MKTEEEVLAALGYTGWRLVGQVQATERVPSQGGTMTDAQRLVAEADGGSTGTETTRGIPNTYLWTVTSPDGMQHEQFTVRAISAGDGMDYQIVKPPGDTNRPPTPSAAAARAGTTRQTTHSIPGGGTVLVTEIADGNGTWSVDERIPPKPYIASPEPKPDKPDTSIQVEGMRNTAAMQRVVAEAQLRLDGKLAEIDKTASIEAQKAAEAQIYKVENLRLEAELKSAAADLEYERGLPFKEAEQRQQEQTGLTSIYNAETSRQNTEQADRTARANPLLNRATAGSTTLYDAASKGYGNFTTGAVQSMVFSPLAQALEVLNEGVKSGNVPANMVPRAQAPAPPGTPAQAPTPPSSAPAAAPAPPSYEQQVRESAAVQGLTEEEVLAFDEEEKRRKVAA